MFTLVQANEIEENADLVRLTYKLRKKVFADQLNWNVKTEGGLENDEYDDENAHYLIWCSDDRKVLFGHIRLIATIHPTLLFDVFGRTHQNDQSLIGSEIFEGTRMCIDEGMIAEHHPEITAANAFSLLFLSLCEAALSLGVRCLVSNFEPAMSRVYRRVGLKYKFHGMSHGFGKYPVCCASFNVSVAVLREMRLKVGVTQPIFTPNVRFYRALPMTAIAA